MKTGSRTWSLQHYPGGGGLGVHVHGPLAEVDLSRTVEVVEETGKREKDFDYSKKDIDDGLAQVTYLEVSNVNVTDNELSIDFDSDDEGEDENVKESGPI